MTSGIVFDLQRTSLHDGPGIRTAVFLKGCPLRCLWCHNPESQGRHPEISFRPEACTACGACVEACPQGAHRLSSQPAAHSYDRSLCRQCGACAEACLFEALKLTGRETTPAQVLVEVRKDVRYFLNSGGGLTITGGEPMLQLDFTLELLQAARTEGIQTCLETCGWASRRAYQQVLPWVDLFLFDYKATGAAAHRRLTGASNARILANLDYLYTQGAQIRLRCPLAPGVNDTPEHLAGIAALERQYPRLAGIDLLPYHNLGGQKYAQHGLPNPLPGLPSAGEAEQQVWLQALCALGSTRAAFA